MERRDFLKKLGLGLAATAGLASVGCKQRETVSTETSTDREVPTDKMTYRTTPSTGDKVSLLGYGCMRWPMMPDPNGGEGAEIVDQEAVNELVDYALAHGVNYFDTAPTYVRGRSEEITGIALSRHPRNS